MRSLGPRHSKLLESSAGGFPLVSLVVLCLAFCLEPYLSVPFVFAAGHLCQLACCPPSAASGFGIVRLQPALFDTNCQLPGGEWNSALGSGNITVPTTVLVGSLEGAEVRLLAHLVRCRVSGFMVLLPALEEVFALLEQLVDGDGHSLVVQKGVDVPLEDARGRRFGSGQMVLVDMPAECAAHFVRTPALRGNAAAGLLRMMAQNSIARPSMRGAHQAAEFWISELAADEVLLEHFTAEEGEAASPVQSNVSPEVVQQLQARIAQLEIGRASCRERV